MSIPDARFQKVHCKKMGDYAVSHKLWMINLLSLIEKRLAYRHLENTYLKMENYLALPKKAAASFKEWNNLSENMVVPIH